LNKERKMESIVINGLTVKLVDGNLVVEKDGQPQLKTKGNPMLIGNPGFASMQEAIEYFELMGLHLPAAEPLPDVKPEPVDVLLPAVEEDSNPSSGAVAEEPGEPSSSNAAEEPASTLP
jgi:hypothetical protein